MLRINYRSFIFFYGILIGLAFFNRLSAESEVKILSKQNGPVQITGDKKLARTLLSPASTFKVPLAILALKKQIITPSSSFLIEDSYITKIPRYANLRESMFRSSNDYFIKVYGLLGKKEVIKFLKNSGPQYTNLKSLPESANKDAAHGGDIKITPLKQHIWMQRLASGNITGSSRLQNQILETLNWPSPAHCNLYGKTGSWDRTLWFTGFGRCSEHGPYQVVTIVRRQYYTKERRMAVISEFYKSFGLNPPEL